MTAEKHCPRCNEDWPADGQFFYADVNSKDGLFYCCKACYALLRTPESRRKDANLPLTGRPTDALAQLRWIGAGQ